MKFLTFLTDLPDKVLGRALREGYRPAAVAFGFSLVSNILYLWAGSHQPESGDALEPDPDHVVCLRDLQRD